MSDTKLLPCPFCGAVACTEGVEVCCLNTDCLVVARSVTRKAWNTRVPDPRLAAAQSLADALRAMLEPLPDHDVIEALMADAGLGYRRFPATYSDKAVTEFRAALAAWEQLK